MTRHVVKLFVRDSDDANDATESALSALNRLPGTKVEVVDWPHESRVRVLLPFAETETGVRYYGVTSIAGFVRRQLELLAPVRIE